MGSIYAKQVIKIAKDWVGYKEGPNNWTKMAEVLDACGYYAPQKKQNVEWCGTFCWFCILEAAIPEDRSNVEKKWDALNYTYQPSKNNLAAACRYAADYFRSKGATYKAKDAKPGDIIFFGPPGNETHQGLVVEVKNGRIYTIEGNKNNQVQECDYSVNYSKISCVGRPTYDEEPEVVDPKPEEKEPVKEEVPDYTKEPDPKKTIDELAKEVIEGKWGNGSDRVNALEDAGYEYQPVQDRVNEILKPKSVAYEVVNVTTKLNVRWGASKNDPIRRQIKNGDTVYVYEIKNNFGKISSSKDEWVSMDYLQKV